jgi:hypothetical protein
MQTVVVFPGRPRRDLNVCLPSSPTRKEALNLGTSWALKLLRAHLNDVMRRPMYFHLLDWVRKMTRKSVFCRDDAETRLIGVHYIRSDSVASVAYIRSVTACPPI